jgi:hypothetical protein
MNNINEIQRETLIHLPNDILDLVEIEVDDVRSMLNWYSSWYVFRFAF